MGRGVWQATVHGVTKSRTRLSDFTTVHQIMMIVVEVVEVVVLVMVAATILMRSDFLFFPWTNTNIRFSTSNAVHSMFGGFSNILIYRNMNPILSAYSSPFIPSVSQSVQSLGRVRLFATPRITACHASLSITNSRSPLKLTSIKSMMPSSHLILCRPLLLLPPIPPSIRVFSMEIFKSATYSYYSTLVLSLFLGKISVSLISFS